MTNSERSRTVSITGATGFLGWHLGEAFRDAGWRVRGIVRPGNRKPLPQGVEAVEAALDSVRLIEAAAGSDLLVHSAGLVRAATNAEIETVNVGGTRWAIDAANAAGARLLFISSQAAIGPSTAARPCAEDDLPHPLTAYGRSKLAAEALVRSTARVPWTIVRPSAVYGPRDRGFLPLFQLASRGVFLMVAPPQTAFTFIHVSDLVRGLMLAATGERAIGQTLFLGHPQPSTAGEFSALLAAALGRPYRPVRIPAAAVRIAGLVGDLCWRVGLTPPVDSARAAEVRAEGFVCSVVRASAVLGFTAAQPLAAGLAQTAQWYREQGWL